MNNRIKTDEIEGKTIAKATFMKAKNFDDEGWLQLDFTDGSSCLIESGYGGYSGKSIDEYPTFIEILDGRYNLIENYA